MFSARNLSEIEAELIADAYFKSGKNAIKIADTLQIEEFDLTLLRHPVVARKILDLAQIQSRKYTLDEHLDKLKQIRDLCMDDANYKTALAAEIAVGKAAGLYEFSNREEQSDEKTDPQKLSTDEIRNLLAKKGVMRLEHLPTPEEVEEVREEIYGGGEDG